MSTSNIRKTMSPVGVRLTTSERRALDELAKRLGLSNAETFRHLLREAGQPPRLTAGSVVHVVTMDADYEIVALWTSGQGASLDLKRTTMSVMTEPAEDAPVDGSAEESADEVDTEDAADEDAA